MLKRGKKSGWIRRPKSKDPSSGRWSFESARNAGAAANGKRTELQPRYIYVLTNPLIEGWVKVGMSADPYSRVRQLSCGNPEDLSVEFCYEMKEGQKDTDFHPALKNQSKKHNREWFQISVEDAIRSILNVYSRAFLAPSLSNE